MKLPKSLPCDCGGTRIWQRIRSESWKYHWRCQQCGVGSVFETQFKDLFLKMMKSFLYWETHLSVVVVYGERKLKPKKVSPSGEPA
jgi:hypothetical protein